MATMLGLFSTDAVVSPTLPCKKMPVTHTPIALLNCTLSTATPSTSDSLILCSDRASGGGTPSASEAFLMRCTASLLNLAHLGLVQEATGDQIREIAIKSQVRATDADAKTHGNAIANSPLIKTAIAGQDPNWAALLWRIGKSGARGGSVIGVDPFGDVEVAKDGWRSRDYSEQEAAAHIEGTEHHQLVSRISGYLATGQGNRCGPA